MTATRSIRKAKHYSKYLEKSAALTDACEFCAIGPDSPQYISRHRHFKLIRNIFPYTVWDSQTIDDHLLLLPLTHTESLTTLPKAAAVEFVDIISEYESRGYSIYARAPGTVTKSVLHQHTHLIKLSGKKVRMLIFWRRPYLRLLLK